MANILDVLDVPWLPDGLARTEARLRDAVTAEDPYLTEIAGHLIGAGGKRLRPVLTMVAAAAGGSPVTDDVITGGVSVELVHIGSLYHDDVMDDAETRRGVPSVNAKWGNLVAILSGDFLLSRASELAASLGTEVAGLLAATIGRLCEGQVGELKTAYSADRSEAAHAASISGKTASLLATAARIGGIVAGLPRDQIDALTTFGDNFGMAFQLVDDVLDLVATDEELGKPAGNDLVEGVYTLPVIRALASDDIGPQLRPLLGTRLDSAARDTARDLVRASGGIDYTIERARDYLARGTDALGALPANPVRDGMAKLGDAVLDTLPRRS
ncbi:MAG TPA: polyprenyl synthetase family protein [Acidimicrobiales bacterium]|nr:polyprenyl synthetase family protein [Acidimicrobiales bacterium]